MHAVILAKVEPLTAGNVHLNIILFIFFLILFLLFIPSLSIAGIFSSHHVSTDATQISVNS